MLSALLLAGLVAAPLATIALFVPTRDIGNSNGAAAWTRRLVFALVGTAILAIAVGAALRAIGVTTTNIEGALAGLLVMSLVWLPVTRRWNARAHLAWAMTLFLFVGYLAFMLDWTFISHLGAAGTTGGLGLWLLELFAAILGCAYLWELCDALGREQWRRRIGGAEIEAAAASGAAPFVSLHVPAHFEPAEMVIETLRSLKALDYENYEIIAIDDNTEDEAIWRPLEAWCRDNDVKFVHLEDWPGYKSGALNYALEHMIDPRTELIGVIDADYQLEPTFLRQCAGLFEDPKIGFIQAPQDYRDWEGAPFFRRLYYSYLYFFKVSQPSRNERDGAIFAGTMGLIRRQALVDVGRWDEWCITEDAELSLRLLRKGWSGLHVDTSFGHGVMPLTFEALKGQRFRWCFGGIQILRRHWRWMLPGRRDEENRLNIGQRWAYLSGAVQWYGDLLGLVFFVFLLAGAANIALGGGLLFRKLSGFLVAAIPLLVGLGLVRAVALLRRGTGASWRDAFGAFMIWQSTSLVVARASVQALYAKEAEFLRTPKTSEEAHFWDAIKGNRGETILAALGLAGIVAALTRSSGYGGPLTAALLAWPTFAFATAPLNSLAAQRAALPAELRERRRTEFLRDRRARQVTLAVGGFAIAAGSAAAIVALLAPGAARIVTPQLLRPARGQAVSYARVPGPAPSNSPTGSPGPSASPGAPGSVNPTGSATPSGSTAPSSSPPSAGPSASPSASSSASPSAAATATASGTPSP
ncbi:MAG TPA: glycosyltransferase [Mycobacteriales bacterium]|nr:glycosyltransferase [Mycobacteriales bacterium]